MTTQYSAAQFFLFLSVFIFYAWLCHGKAIGEWAAVGLILRTRLCGKTAPGVFAFEKCPCPEEDLAGAERREWMAQGGMGLLLIIIMGHSLIPYYAPVRDSSFCEFHAFRRMEI